MAFPIKITWANKETAKTSTKPTNQKLVAAEANELRDKHNTVVDYLPIHIYSDSNGYLIAPSVLNPDVSLVNVNIGTILGVGTLIYTEYNSTKNTSGDFSKDLGENTIMIANTHTPMAFLQNSMFILNKR